MLRSSAHLLRKLCDKSHSSGLRGVEAAAAAASAARRLSGSSTSSARDTSLLRPLPGLDLPPALPDLLGRSPTVITTLPNGVRVASEDVPGPSACIGIFVDSGSIYESGVTRGVSHLLEKLAFKDTAHRSHQQIVQELELAGGNVGASTAREQMVYSYDTLKAYMPEAVEILLDCVMNPLFSHDEVEYQLTLALEEVQQMQRNPERFLMETLNHVGYSGALANPLIAPEEAFATLNSSIIKKFYHENFTADRVILAASGVEHQDLLDYSEHLLSDWHKGSPVEKPKSTYVGGDCRHKAESDTLMGGGGSFSSGGPGKGMHSRLYLRVLNKYHSVHSFSAFSNVYDNTGLFGIYLTTPSQPIGKTQFQPSAFVAKAVDVAISELIAIATPGEVTEVELQRAKNSTISSVLMNLESRVIVAEDIGRQLLTYGCRKPIDYFLQCMDEMTVDDITAFARKILSSKPTMASWGDVDKVPPYDFVCKRLQ
ncbi:hypothetical protein EJB05_18955 [Eragrostis curvula]|uniref:Uncharacterized protein n=1 Tax=Eragrostis curvula TaxID=38414 RepID=A0A5J9VLI0_9POAL|nr:hypothetical protein EJB05_18955 [Eragrostis curvula]